jgi:hypothetical protein
MGFDMAIVTDPCAISPPRPRGISLLRSYLRAGNLWACPEEVNRENAVKCQNSNHFSHLLR